MFKYANIFLFFLTYIFFVACGANALRFMESKNPEDEAKRISREQNADPEGALKDAKNALGNADAVKALEEFEKIYADNKTPTEEQRKKLKLAIEGVITKDILDKIKKGETAGAEDAIEKIGTLAQAYQETTKYKELDFLGTLLGASSSSGGASLVEDSCDDGMRFFLDVGSNIGEKYCDVEDSCDDGMRFFLDVASNIRKEYCDGNGLLDLDNLEIAYIIRSTVLTDKLISGEYEFSKDILKFQSALSVSDLSYLIDDETFSAYMQSLFFQVIYISCNFVTDDCAIDASKASEDALYRIWESFSFSFPLEQQLKKRSLLPEGLGFTAEKIINDVHQQAKNISNCEYEDPIYCALKLHFDAKGKECQGTEETKGSCAAQ